MYTLTSIKKITIEPTTYCNARCPQCDRFDSKNKTIVPLRHLLIEKVEKNLTCSTLPNLNYVIFEGNAGDILNHYDPIGLLSLFDNQQVDFITNGSIRDTSFYRKLAKFKNLSITFSIDGLLDTYDLYRQNCSFKKVIENASTYIKYGGKAVWKFIVFKHNEHQLKEAEKLAKKLNFHDFQFQHSDRSWYNGNKLPVYNNGIYQDFVLEPSSIITNNNTLNSDTRNLNNIIVNKFKNAKLPIICPMEQKEIFVEAAGYVIPCCMLSNDFWLKEASYNYIFLKKLKLNEININTHDMKSILKSDFFINLKTSLKSKPMPKCIHFCSKAKDDITGSCLSSYKFADRLAYVTSTRFSNI